MKAGVRRTAAGKRIGNDTIVFYGCVLKLLQEFEAQKALQIAFRLLPRYNIKQTNIEKRYWLRFYRVFTAYMYGKGFFDGYVGSIWKSLKVVVHWIIKEKVLPIAPVYRWFIVPATHFNPVVLSIDKLQFMIYKTSFTNNLPSNLLRIKHIFIAGCTLGLRYGDLIALEKKNYVLEEGNPFIRLYTHKTGSYISIPVPQYLVGIFSIYIKKPGKFLLPQFSNSRFNILVKRLGETAGWTDTLPKYMCRRGTWIEQKKPGNKSWQYFDHLTSHTMRRTAITSLLILGVPEQVVRKISGHAAGSKEFYKYVAIAEGYLSKEVQAAHQKLAQVRISE